VLDEHGFGHHGTGAAGTGEPGDCRQQMQNKDDQIAHPTILPRSRHRQRMLANFGIRHAPAHPEQRRLDSCRHDPPHGAESLLRPRLFGARPCRFQEQPAWVAIACGAHVRPFSDSRVSVEAASRFNGGRCWKHRRQDRHGFHNSDGVIGRHREHEISASSRRGGGRRAQDSPQVLTLVISGVTFVQHAIVLAIHP
jgi:hypothetical protein